MYSPVFSIDFSSRSILASALFQPPMPSRASRLPRNSRVLTLLRTLFLSLRSFSRSPRLFSTACALFCKNTRGWGYLCDDSAPPCDSALSLALDFARPLFSYSYELPPRTHRFATSFVSRTYKSLFSQAVCFDNHLRCPLYFCSAPFRSLFLCERRVHYFSSFQSTCLNHATAQPRSTFNCRTVDFPSHSAKIHPTPL